MGGCRAIRPTKRWPNRERTRVDRTEMGHRATRAPSPQARGGEQMRARVRRSMIFACLLAVFAAAATAAELPEDFRLEPVLLGLTEPSALAFTPDRRILIAERTGRDETETGQCHISPRNVSENTVNKNAL